MEGVFRVSSVDSLAGCQYLKPWVCFCSVAQHWVNGDKSGLDQCVGSVGQWLVYTVGSRNKMEVH